MVNEAERYAKDDEHVRERVAAKNGLESYAYNLRNSLSDDKLKDKFEGGDKEKLEKAVDETIKWLDASMEASKEEFEGKQKELEEVANPIMRKLYAGAGGAGGAGGPGGFPGGGFPGGFPGGGDAGGSGSGPSVEEGPDFFGARDF